MALKALQPNTFELKELFVLKLATQSKNKGEWLTGELLLKEIKEKFTLERQSDLVIKYIDLLLEAY